MKIRRSPYGSSRLNWGAIQIAGLYLLTGGIWISFSDKVAASIALDRETFITISLYKGWGYILVTALLLYWIIRHRTAALQASEQQLHTVIDAFPALISYVDANRRYQFTNNAYEEWFNHTAQGKHMEEVIGKVAYKTISKHVDRVLAGETVSYETEIPYQDGGARFVHAYYVPDKGANGQVRGFFALVEDISEHKQAQEERQLWADAFEGCAYGIAIGDPDTNRILVCNPAFAGMHKCRVEDIVGSGILSLYAPSNHELVRRGIERADQIGHSRFEARMVRRDRSTFPVETDVVSVLGDNGDVLHRVVTAQDISERMQAEKVLQESEERYRIVSELTSDYAYKDRIESDGSIIPEWFTESFTRITGYALEETRAPEFWQRLLHPEDLPILLRHVQKILSGQPDTDEMRVITKSGEIRWLRDFANPTWDASQEHVTGLYGAVQDVTESKRGEENLRKSEERYRQLFENHPHPMWIYDRNTLVFLDVNEAAIAKYGFSRQEFLSMTIVDIRPPEDVEQLMNNLAKPRQSLEQSESWRHRLKDGTIIYVQITSHTFEIDGHESALVIAQDITERKRVEEESKSLARFPDENPNPVLRATNKGKIIYANAASEHLLNDWHTEVGDDLPADWIKLISELMSTGSRKIIDVQCNDIAYSIMIVPVPQANYVNLYGRDVTERNQAEEKLRKSEDLFSKAFHGSPSPMTIARQRDGVYIEVNNSFLQMVECSREEVIGHTRLDLNLIDSEGRSQIIRQLREQGIIHNVEVQAKSKSGRRLNLLTSIENTELAGEACTITTMLDITERKRAEEALQKAHDELELKVQERTAALSQANNLLQALMDHMPDHIYFKDTQSRFIRNSRSQANALGLSDPAQAVGKTDFDFFPHAAKAYEEEQEIMKSGKPLVDFEEWVVWPDGRETWVSTTKMPLRDASGQTIGIFGISRDITERKRTEQAVRQLNADLEKQATQLQAANKELEAFSYSVSHDLRAPLRAIDGYTRILVEDYESILDNEGKRVCNVISKEARRMGQLIDDLLSFSRLGRREMHSSKLDMKALAVSVFNELMKEENEERIDFRIAKLPSVKGDISLVRQVWINLLSNAIKFTSKKERAVIEVGSKPNKDELIYYVRDTGTGFDMEYSNKLFGVFQRLHSESEFSGTGVGLAIVQRIIRRHGGRVWAEGEVDKGATFYFALPRKEKHHD
jgi:PAS domain S-box-containing protein